MRIKVKNEKDKIYVLQRLGFLVDEYKFFEKVVYSHRILPQTALIEIIGKGNQISVIYDDYSRFNVIKLMNKSYRRIDGGFSRQLIEAYNKGILKELIYNNNKGLRSEVKFIFSNNIREFSYIADIIKYIEEPKDMYFGIIDVYRDIVKVANGNIDKGVYLLAEFLLNLVQHNYRKHNKYVEIENGYGIETSIGIDNNIILGHKDIGIERIDRLFSKVRERGYTEVIVNCGIYQGNLSYDEKAKLKQKAVNKGLSIDYIY